ncbi:phosphonate ABC transporter ATP-binding protein [Limnoraphis robusta]|uniref:Phosphonate ABC transporter ATP-binidng protein n=1 Tax=Limnoraphis robusta CS-951 TaxID=1637645 RepID=A0A0F5YB15_9CYAN|nr:phosphonate ABC transporter ATP-binding protein [Limnoraphis robusta]KKD36121.1 phosphonate ABC transporter ATP-binidng protein [Limnoraphis robusta CS-951]
MLKETAVEVTHLTKSFRGKTALQKVSFSVESGEMVALVGASGSGKSTLLRHLNGLERGDSGVVKVFDFPLQSDGKFHSKIRQLRSNMGCIFQQFNLVKRLSVIENVLVGNLAQMSFARSAIRYFTKAEKIQALSALERVGILEQAYKRASMLSGGQQQRVAIARCLVQGSRIILADEPIASLDPESARKVMELLSELNQQNGITVITSLHQVQMVQQYFLRAVALKNGEVLFDGPTEALDKNRLNELYGSAAKELVLSGHGELLV